MNRWSLFVDLVKGIAWPAAVVSIVLLFRSEIRGLLPRIREAGPTGVKIDPSGQQDQKAPPINELPKSAHLLRPAQQLEVDRIKEQLKAISPSDHESDLIVALALARLSSYFENTYSLILGSQLSLLRRLNASDVMDLDQARQFFAAEVAKRDPEPYKNFSFESWLHYLLSRNLVSQTGGKISISEHGREFLLYIHQMQYPDDKLL